MYKALFNFDGKEKDRTLSFMTGDEFNLIEQVNEHWWKMQSSVGDIGLVPASYLAINKTIKSEIIESIDRAIDILHKTAGKRGGPMTPDERRSLQKLIAHRQNVAEDKSVDAEQVGGETNSTTATQSHQTDVNLTSVQEVKEKEDEYIYMDLPDQPKRQAPIPPKEEAATPNRQQSQSFRARRKAPAPPSKSRSFSESPGPGKKINENISLNNNAPRPLNQIKPFECDQKHVKSLKAPDSLGLDLLSQVMKGAKIDEKKSEKAVKSVLEAIKRSIPDLSDLMDTILEDIPRIQQLHETKTFGPEDEMRIILDDLSKRKDDSQQRSWALHEDFHIIQSLLNKLLKILADNSKDVSMNLLREDDYHYLNNLVVYYQMEPRGGLRVLLVQAFGCCCQFGYEFITQLLCTVLPTELARELSETDNLTNFLNIALLMTMLFSTGESIPLHQYAQLNESFIEFMFDCVERPHINDEYDQIPYSIVSVILSFNQHFREPAENKVMQVLSGRTDLSVFTEKLILLINREDDPVAIFDYHKPSPNSVLKMLQDIFSRIETANIFFTNDLMVLIDIVLRQLTDRSHGDKVRTQFLSLFYDIITNSNYKEHRHRCNEFGECFTNILVDEEHEIEDDKYIVRNICSEFNALFPIFI